MRVRGKGRKPNYHRFQKLRKRYGLSEDDYALMLARQRGVCLICSYAPSSLDKHLVVDHCHGSNEVRGLLCQYCNKGLGFFKDSPKLLRRAALYLIKSIRYSKIRRQKPRKAK